MVPEPTQNSDRAILDDLIGTVAYLSTSPNTGDWQNRCKSNIQKIDKALASAELNTLAFRHEPGHIRDFKSMFGRIANQSVTLLIEDPYLAVSDRNRDTLSQFLQKLQQLSVHITSLTLSWRPPRAGLSNANESQADQKRNLMERLQKIGLDRNIVHLKPRTSRQRHFHDRIVTAIVASENAPVASFRWDISSGIDNLMELERQCSVFLTETLVEPPKKSFPSLQV